MERFDGPAPTTPDKVQHRDDYIDNGLPHNPEPLALATDKAPANPNYNGVGRPQYPDSSYSRRG